MYDETLKDIYVDEKKIAYERERYIKAIESYTEHFGEGEVFVFSAPGRSEIGGNHTDHQCGEVLAASINNDAIAIVQNLEEPCVRVISAGYEMITIYLDDLCRREDEEATTTALIRGVLAKAKEYARKAIDTGNYVPTNKADWTNTTSGFNDISATSWMWGASVQKEDDVVKSGIINWTSWMSGEAAYGYAGAGPVPMADVRFYNKISDKDFRKLSWKAPKGSALESQNEYCNPSSAVDMAEYASLKFRPGSGNVSDYNVGSATSFPLMRIEEMYFIEAEAAAHLNASDGVSLINSFMKGYRYPSYECKVTNQDDVVEEIVFQKRVELWGEGQSFFDIKRLNLPVTRAYEGSMHHAIGRFNTTTRPAWMNICIVQTEENNNKALLGYENPDPSDCYKAE